MPTSLTRKLSLAALAAGLILVAACGGDDGGDGGGGDDTETSTTASTAVSVDTLEIMVTNDDGYEGEGLDALVEGLLELPAVEVTVVAPALDESGSGDATTPGPLVADEVETLSGYPALAVQGEPADTVVYALAEVFEEPPDLVVSGINAGQNQGPLVELSGTVGAARLAAREGIPAVAVSQGLPEPFDYAAGVDAVITWITENRDDLGADAGEVVNLNVPTCVAGEIRGVAEVPLATGVEGALEPADCTSTLENPADDVQALINGYISLSVIDADDPVPGN